MTGMDERQSDRATPPKSDGSFSWRALVAAICVAIWLIVRGFQSVPSSRIPTVPLFNPFDISVAGCAIACGLLSVVRRERLWPLGIVATVLSATPFVLQLFPAFRHY